MSRSLEVWQQMWSAAAHGPDALALIRAAARNNREDA